MKKIKNKNNCYQCKKGNKSTSRREPFESRQICWGQPQTAIFYSKLKIYIFDLEYCRQGHKVQHSKWSHSIRNINIYKSRSWAFFSSSHRFPDIHIWWPRKCRSKSWSRHSHWHPSMTNTWLSICWQYVYIIPVDTCQTNKLTSFNFGLGHWIEHSQFCGIGHLVEHSQFCGIGHWIEQSQFCGIGHWVDHSQFCGIGHWVEHSQFCGIGHWVEHSQFRGIGHWVEHLQDRKSVV